MSAQSETDQSKFARLLIILTQGSVMSANIEMKSYESEAALR